MQYKRYVKLRKYVNGEPTDEYKKGNLVEVITTNTLKECEGTNGQTN